MTDTSKAIIETSNTSTYEKDWESIKDTLGVSKHVLKYLAKSTAGATIGGFLAGSALGLAHDSLKNHKVSPKRATQYGLVGALTTGLITGSSYSSLVKVFKTQYLHCRETGGTKHHCELLIKKSLAHYSSSIFSSKR